MATRRSMVYDDVDQQLARAIRESAAAYKKYRVEPFSGNAPRPRNPQSLHPLGRAIDVNLIDPVTGEVLPNIGRHAKSAVEYQAYANSVYKWALENDPQLAKELYWGGYFKGGGWPQDYMHFQRGGTPPAGGTWAGGFDSDVMRKLGLSSSGGLGDLSAASMSAPTDPRLDTPSSGRPSLGGYSDSPSESGGARFGGTGLGTPPADPVAVENPAVARRRRDRNSDALAASVANLQGEIKAPQGVPLLPSGGYTQAPMAPGVNQASMDNRNRLAQIMALMGQGRLF